MNYIVFDLDWNQSPDGKKNRNEKLPFEIIEIGAVKVNSKKEITDSFGTTVELAEKDFDTFTALAGSSPAYIALFIEALAKAGVKNGLSKQVALTIATQTVLATAENLSLGSDSPHDLIDKVCSPGGTTIAGLMDLERTGLTHSVVSSIDTTIAKAKKL